ncbi:hypothetical protein TNIN_168111 [Trichonephila inaurata madagascariensis]|uniref:Uncharacterized protein n=1 Tax=Trichonephila inaurata madagascariensis TaxID=2747483 RepID=A0A8X6IVJ4_9ARAC|nr:hypothetical protein TNIN_168111 [Trichonephila inaurata madagascariensis]
MLIDGILYPGDPSYRDVKPMFRYVKQYTTKAHIHFPKECRNGITFYSIMELATVRSMSACHTIFRYPCLVWFPTYGDHFVPYVSNMF